MVPRKEGKQNIKQTENANQKQCRHEMKEEPKKTRDCTDPVLSCRLTQDDGTGVHFTHTKLDNYTSFS